MHIPPDAFNIHAKLVGASIWNTHPNVTSATYMEIKAPTVTYTINFPVGQYSIETLNNQLSRELLRVGASADLLTMSGESSTLKVYFISTLPVTLVFPSLSFQRLLGVGPSLSVPSPGVHTFAPGKARINSINSYRIHNDMIGQGLQINGEYQGCLADIQIIVAPGKQVQYQPNYPLAIDLTGLEGSNRHEMQSTLLTDTGEPALTGEPWSYVFEVAYEHPSRNTTQILT